MTGIANETPGSSALDDEQADQMLDLYGQRFRHVETGVHGVGNSRRVRRAAGQRGKPSGMLAGKLKGKRH